MSRHSFFQVAYVVYVSKRQLVRSNIEFSKAIWLSVKNPFLFCTALEDIPGLIPIYSP